MSDWSRFKYVGAEIVPGEPLNLFEDTESNETGEKGAREFSGEEGGEWNEGGEKVEEEGGERVLNERGLQSGGWRLPEPISREPLWTDREPQLENTGLRTYTSPPRVTYPSRSPIDNPQILPPPTRSPPILSPPIRSPPPINSPPIYSLPSIYSPPIYSPPTSIPEYIQIESQSSSPPSPVFSASSITESESSMPMGPPPMVPSVMPGGGGGGGNNVQEISGLAGEAIYL